MQVGGSRRQQEAAGRWRLARRCMSEMLMADARQRPILEHFFASLASFRFAGHAIFIHLLFSAFLSCDISCVTVWCCPDLDENETLRIIASSHNRAGRSRTRFARPVCPTTPAMGSSLSTVVSTFSNPDVSCLAHVRQRQLDTTNLRC